jgi:hypothetical protein
MIRSTVRRRSGKAGRNLLLTSWSRQFVGLPEVVPSVVLGEDFEREVAVASIPDLLVEAAYESLVLLRRHRYLRPAPKVKA